VLITIVLGVMAKWRS